MVAEVALSMENFHYYNIFLNDTGCSFLRTESDFPRHHQLSTLKQNEFLSIVQLQSISDFSFDFLFESLFLIEEEIHLSLTRQIFHPTFTSVIDQSFQRSSSGFLARTETRTLLNPHGVATTERNSRTYEGQFLPGARNLSALMYCNYILD